MAVYKFSPNKTKETAENWTDNKAKNARIVETVGFVPLEKRLQIIDKASLARSQYMKGIYGDDDLLYDEDDELIKPDDREDSFEDFDPTSDSEFTLVDVTEAEKGIKERQAYRDTIKAKKASENAPESVSEAKKDKEEETEK